MIIYLLFYLSYYLLLLFYHRNLQDKPYHIPCLGHIINLAVQSILGPSGLNETVQEYDPPANETESSDEMEPALEELTTLQKLRKGIIRIRFINLIHTITISIAF